MISDNHNSRTFAEVERGRISKRTKGRRFGRPKGALGKSTLDGREEEIRILLQKRVSKASIAKRLRVSRIAMYHFIDSRTLDPNASHPQSRAHRP